MTVSKSFPQSNNDYVLTPYPIAINLDDMPTSNPDKTEITLPEKEHPIDEVYKRIRPRIQRVENGLVVITRNAWAAHLTEKQGQTEIRILVFLGDEV